MANLFFVIITFIIVFVSLICFSCLAISSNYDDTTYESYLRHKIITEIIETKE